MNFLRLIYLCLCLVIPLFANAWLYKPGEIEVCQKDMGSIIMESFLDETGDTLFVRFRSNHNVVSHEERHELQHIIESIIPSESWLKEYIIQEDWYPRFPDLFFNFSLEKADSIIKICEDWVRGNSTSNSLYDEEPDAIDLCRILNGGKLRKVSYGTGEVRSFMTTIKRYSKYKHLFTPRLYQLLELAFSFPYNGYVPWITRLSDIDNWKMEYRRGGLCEAVWEEIMTGRKEFVDSVLNQKLIEFNEE